ncbi:hypothetical protein S245_043250, partial [Arachis hypogaea]
ILFPLPLGFAAAATDRAAAGRSQIGRGARHRTPATSYNRRRNQDKCFGSRARALKSSKSNSKSKSHSSIYQSCIALSCVIAADLVILPLQKNMINNMNTQRSSRKSSKSSLWEYTNIVMNFLSGSSELNGSKSFAWLQYFDIFKYLHSLDVEDFKDMKLGYSITFGVVNGVNNETKGNKCALAELPQTLINTYWQHKQVFRET